MTQTYRVIGMSCQGCVNAVTQAIQGIAPGASITADLDGKTVTVDGIDDGESVRQAVEGAGFEFGGPATP